MRVRALHRPHPFSRHQQEAAMIGFRILQRQRQVSKEIMEKFRQLPVANVSDMMSRMTAGGARLRPFHAGAAMAGPALTVKTRPGDNLMVHKALDLAAPGDVVVVDAGGDLTNAIVGELMLAYAIQRKLGGIVINGAVRDVAAVRQQKFPVFAAGATHRGPYKDGPGEINVPIAIDGMVVEPGDLVLGDEDGVMCVPYEHVETVYTATKAKHAAELKQMAEIEAGTSDRNWVDATLKKLGCEF
jgi:RraA family protein